MHVMRILRLSFYITKTTITMFTSSTNVTYIQKGARVTTSLSETSKHIQIPNIKSHNRQVVFKKLCSRLNRRLLIKSGGTCINQKSPHAAGGGGGKGK